MLPLLEILKEIGKGPKILKEFVWMCGSVHQKREWPPFCHVQMSVRRESISVSVENAVQMRPHTSDSLF